MDGCAGYDNHATLWPILHAETFKNFSLAEFQDGTDVAISQQPWVGSDKNIILYLKKQVLKL